MTTIPFVPDPVTAPPFTTLVTLDGTAYTLATAWNFSRGDWYVGLGDQNGNTIAYQPLVGSPPDRDIPLFPGMFTRSKLIYRVDSGVFEQTP